MTGTGLACTEAIPSRCPPSGATPGRGGRPGRWDPVLRSRRPDALADPRRGTLAAEISAPPVGASPVCFTGSLHVLVPSDSDRQD